MTQGNLYFIANEYFEKFDEGNLKPNKDKDYDNGLGFRPHYFSYQEETTGIMWFVPLSTQVDKYQRVYNECAQKYDSYDGIRFGYVLGKKNAFLIQNMSPISKEYIIGEYTDSTTKIPIIIKGEVKSSVNACVRKAVRLYRKGIKIVHPDILDIEKTLLEEIETDRQSLNLVSSNIE